ncbi:hypothetical protein JG688_00004404 [Phytophthora aleatoria]|uniref:Uncharacterized protein n=1 Tax=Phytophthora aleatoria TaxID=2496075 RepID=A0A8J5IQ18_9STRA|nr:hypothetical protein JG688_00004404 [Phytophthora aleatoria]
MTSAFISSPPSTPRSENISSWTRNITTAASREPGSYLDFTYMTSLTCFNAVCVCSESTRSSNQLNSKGCRESNPRTSSSRSSTAD